MATLKIEQQDFSRTFVHRTVVSEICATVKVVTTARVMNETESLTINKAFFSTGWLNKLLVAGKFCLYPVVLPQPR